jgi:hypothetical protein
MAVPQRTHAHIHICTHTHTHTYAHTRTHADADAAHKQWTHSEEWSCFHNAEQGTANADAPKRRSQAHAIRSGQGSLPQPANSQWTRIITPTSAAGLTGRGPVAGVTPCADKAGGVHPCGARPGGRTYNYTSVDHAAVVGVCARQPCRRSGGGRCSRRGEAKRRGQDCRGAAGGVTGRLRWRRGGVRSCGGEVEACPPAHNGYACRGALARSCLSSRCQVCTCVCMEEVCGRGRGVCGRWPGVRAAGKSGGGYGKGHPSPPYRHPCSLSCGMVPLTWARQTSSRKPRRGPLSTPPGHCGPAKAACARRDFRRTCFPKRLSSRWTSWLRRCGSWRDPPPPPTQHTRPPPGSAHYTPRA